MAVPFRFNVSSPLASYPKGFYSCTSLHFRVAVTRCDLSLLTAYKFNPLSSYSYFGGSVLSSVCSPPPIDSSGSSTSSSTSLPPSLDDFSLSRFFSG